MNDQPFEVKIVITFVTTSDEFWADGYGPENPTVDDVIAAIRNVYSAPEELIREYDGDGIAEITVDGKDVYPRADSGSDGHSS